MRLKPHPDLKADFILANPPFNISDWGGERLVDDKRWQYGTPPKGNANFAWVQHIVHHLAPAGAAGFVLANGSMSSSQSGEGGIRKSLIEADRVDCMVALPGQLFYSTQIPAADTRRARNLDRLGKPAHVELHRRRGFSVGVLVLLKQCVEGFEPEALEALECLGLHVYEHAAFSCPACGAPARLGSRAKRSGGAFRHGSGRVGRAVNGVGEGGSSLCLHRCDCWLIGDS